VPRAYPYGIYDLGRNVGFVNVGTDHDTGAFAVASIRGWWRAEGRHLYPRTRRLLITADAGGRNGWRLRLWNWELQRLADQTGLTLRVCHFPPGCNGPHFLDKKKPFLRWWAALKMKESQCPEPVRVTRPA